jgi:hypothetical protein
VGTNCRTVNRETTLASYMDAGNRPDHFSEFSLKKVPSTRTYLRAKIYFKVVLFMALKLIYENHELLRKSQYEKFY